MLKHKMGAKMVPKLDADLILFIIKWLDTQSQAVPKIGAHSSLFTFVFDREIKTNLSLAFYDLMV